MLFDVVKVDPGADLPMSAEDFAVMADALIFSSSPATTDDDGDSPPPPPPSPSKEGKFLSVCFDVAVVAAAGQAGRLMRLFEQGEEAVREAVAAILRKHERRARSKRRKLPT